MRFYRVVCRIWPLLLTSVRHTSLSETIAGPNADMEWLSMDYGFTQPSRLQRLHKLAHQVREAAINRPGDLDGWRLSRLLRDAETPAQADEAERLLEAWDARFRQPVQPCEDHQDDLQKDFSTSTTVCPSTFQRRAGKTTC